MPKGRNKSNNTILLLIVVLLSSLSIMTFLLTNGKTYGNKQTQIEQVYLYKELQDSLSKLDIKIRESTTHEIKSLNKEQKKILEAKVARLRNNFIGETLLDEDLPIQTKFANWLKKNKNIIYFIVSLLFIFLFSITFLILKQKVKLENLCNSSKIKKSKSQKVQENFKNPLKQTLKKTTISKLSEILEKEKTKNTPTPYDRGPSDNISMKEALNQNFNNNTCDSEIFNFDEAVKNPRSNSEIKKRLHSNKTIEKLKPLPTQPDELNKIFDWPLDEKRNTQQQPNLYPSTLRDLDNRDKKKSDILKLARRGFTSSEISRRLKTSQNEIEILIKLHREKGI